MTDTDTNDTAPCNTNNKRARGWAFTINNPEKDMIEKLKAMFINDELACQEETGKEGTKHIQGVVWFKNARTFNSMKKKLPRAHLEIGKNKKALFNYCTKEETRSGETFDSRDKRPTVINPLEGKELYPWQQQVVDVLSEKPDTRSIYWFVDYEGNNGKTSFAKHIILKHWGEALYLTGKSADCKYGIFNWLKEHKLNVVFFDFVRTIENYVSYQAIEEIKNGIFYNTKYESEMCIFDPVHIICFSNWIPNIENMSKDRWKLFEIKGGEALVLDV